ncbi:MAG: hypothetical protein WKF92_15060 [Pyrinomonadaceae bacterium]
MHTKIRQMNERPKYRFSLAGQPLYPHLKLTRERFPRLLATRIIDNDDAEYFGAFLNRSAARILIDFTNKTFRLRSCQIDIDGEFPVPCTQYYSKRCVAPCVKSLCREKDYLEMVDLVRLFLSNERERFGETLNERIGDAAGRLDFEKAAYLRDIGNRVTVFWQDKKLRVWLNDAVDTLVLETGNDEIKVYLVTQRVRRTLGMRVFVWPFSTGEVPEQALGDVISQFYKFHPPREIRVSQDFPGRLELSRILSRKFGGTIKISVVKISAHQITTERAMTRTKLEDSLAGRKPRPTSVEIGRDLLKIFGLDKIPVRIEAFDAAHISGSDLTAARSIWANGKFLSDEYEFWFSDQASELETLAKFVNKSLLTPRNLPDLILIDGGQSQLNAALKGLAELTERKFSIISAVKRPGKHSEISHFLTENGSRIEFDAKIEAMRVLRVLRDEAHDLANSVHRQSRDMSYFYELPGILPSLDERQRQNLLVKFGSIRKILELDEKQLTTLFGKETGLSAFKDIKLYLSAPSGVPRPLVVPIRFDDPNGEAGDLRPIEAFR